MTYIEFTPGAEAAFKAEADQQSQRPPLRYVDHVLPGVGIEGNPDTWLIPKTTE